MVEVKCEIPKKSSWSQAKCQCKCRTDEKRVRYLQPQKMPSYAPIKVYKPPDAKMSDNSTYKLSYEAFDQKVLRACRGVPTLTKENLVSAGAFSGYTTHKMSYGSWLGIQKEKLIYPKDHKLAGEGPLSSMTTFRHDFQAKKVDTSTKIVPPPNLGFSTAKMETNTTNILSYQCPDFGMFESPVSYKPQMRYLPPSSPLDGVTVHKLSFLPWQPQQKEELPWAKKCPYVTPKVPFDGTTVYNGSFLAPGSVVEDDEGHCQGCSLYSGVECSEPQNLCPEDACCNEPKPEIPCCEPC